RHIGLPLRPQGLLRNSTKGSLRESFGVLSLLAYPKAWTNLERGKREDKHSRRKKTNPNRYAKTKRLR
ncbi:MAG: hypothetical protein KAT86_00075, partial [Candidatus Latescibacteria bacterium]|nr:hypothetical protein [Candidatus Latescibacterota bacterium]